MWFPRGPHGDVDWWVILLLAAFAVLAWLVVRWGRRREARDPDRGGSGYTPVAAPPTPAPPYVPEREVDAEDAWLLGFAAPHVVPTGLDPWAWDLGFADGDDGLRAALHARYGMKKVRWEADTAAVSSELTRASTPPQRAWAVSLLAWQYRLGAADGHLSVTEARTRTLTAARRVGADARDWLEFGELFYSEVRATHEYAEVADRAELFEPGGLWADPDWPR